MPEEAARQLVRKINRLGMIHRIYIRRAASAHELYMGQMPILEYVEAHEGCTQREAAKELGVSPPSVATSVRRMERAGFLTCTGSAADRRATCLALTARGRAVMQACRAECDSVDARMLRGLSEQERQTLSELLDRMIESLDTDGYRSCPFGVLREAACVPDRPHDAADR